MFKHMIVNHARGPCSIQVQSCFIHGRVSRPDLACDLVSCSRSCFMPMAVFQHVTVSSDFIVVFSPVLGLITESFMTCIIY